MPACAQKTSSTCQTIWMEARLNAGYKNRLELTEALFMGERTIARIESGEKIPSPEEALLMAETLKMPHLALRYCSETCPVGKKYRSKIEGKDLATAVLGLLKEHRDIREMKDRLVEISADNKITEDEMEDFDAILGELEELIQAATEIKHWALSEYLRKRPPQAVAELAEKTKNKAAEAAAR